MNKLVSSRIRTIILPFFLPYYGCKQRCIFCNQNISGDSTINQNALGFKKTMNKYLESLHKNPKREVRNIEIALYGGTFTGMRVSEMTYWLKQAGDFVEEGKIKGIRISTTPEMIDYKTAIFLKSFGVTTVELGVPSLDEKVLHTAKRSHQSHEVQVARDILKEVGIITGFQLMIGLPDETHNSRKQTLRRVCQMRPDFVRIHPTIVLAETGLEKLYKAGKYHPMSLQRAIVISANWVKCFEENHIPVVRIGLQPVDKMSERGVILAGPFHPSFGGLVREYLARKELLKRIREAGKESEEITFYVSNRKLSLFKGHYNNNVLWLKKKLPMVKDLKIKALEGLKDFQIQIEK